MSFYSLETHPKLSHFFDTLSPKLLMPLYRLFTADRSNRFTDEVETINRMSISAIRLFQHNRLRAICEYAYNNTEYYRKLFSKLGIQTFSHMTLHEFKRIPVLTKDLIRENQFQLLTKQWPPATLRKTATGGTTSTPVPIYSDMESFWRKTAATLAFDRWFNFVPGVKVAYLWGARQDIPHVNNNKTRLRNLLLTRSLFLPTSPLDSETMFNSYLLLKTYSPTVLQAYPSVLSVFCRFLLNERLTLHIPTIFCAAEVLSSTDSQLIESVFSVKPVNWYGAREAGRIATECHIHKGMHINAYGTYLEIENTSEDDTGAIIITDLWNRGMPLIRYRIGDIGSLTYEPCECGCQLPRLTEVIGRTTDVFVNTKGQRIILRHCAVLKDCNEIQQVQFIQHHYNDIEALIVPGIYYSPNTDQWLSDKINLLMNDACNLKIQLVENIPPENSGKIRFCKSLMGNI